MLPSDVFYGHTTNLIGNGAAVTEASTGRRQEDREESAGSIRSRQGTDAGCRVLRKWR